MDDETKLTLHGLQQYYIKLAETEKNRKLNDLLDLLDFNQASPVLLQRLCCICFIHECFEALSCLLSVRTEVLASRSDGSR